MESFKENSRRDHRSFLHDFRKGFSEGGQGGERWRSFQGGFFSEKRGASGLKRPGYRLLRSVSASEKGDREPSPNVIKIVVLD